jgi:uncharacterized protein YggL (DUF469 family)
MLTNNVNKKRNSKKKIHLDERDTCTFKKHAWYLQNVGNEKKNMELGNSNTHEE